MKFRIFEKFSTKPIWNNLLINFNRMRAKSAGMIIVVITTIIMPAANS
jgi:hypothetical protein